MTHQQEIYAPARGNVCMCGQHDNRKAKSNSTNVVDMIKIVSCLNAVNVPLTYNEPCLIDRSQNFM